MISDIEDYAIMCRERSKANNLGIFDYTKSLADAEPFWRKLAMRYREALEKMGDGPKSNYKEGVDIYTFATFCNETACEALALTRRDLE